MSTPASVALWELRYRRAAEHPAFLAQFVECVDSRSGEHFEFTMLDEREAASVGSEYKGNDWYWQRGYLDWTLDNDQTITLKGRQLGVTWVLGLRGLHVSLFRPGADVLVYSIKEDDAIEVVNRMWDMWLSIPQELKDRIGVRVLKPTRGTRPSTVIEFEHPDGRVSTITGMAATKSAGHGRSAALVIFDEASRQEYARDLWKAVVPAMGDTGGALGVVSTANGMSDDRGEGNFFHTLWKKAGTTDFPKLKRRFLKWDEHPHRDQDWYDAVSLPRAEKAEQYPNDPDEAFLLSGSPYFDVVALKSYAESLPTPLYQMVWEVNPFDPKKATRIKGDGLPITVYLEPEPGRKYAIAADVATGSGEDYSCAVVIDLHTARIVAECYMKGDYKKLATQVHYLGLWFNTARVAVETGGGYGDTVIAYMRDGLDGRKPYPKLYRHTPMAKAKKKQVAKYGFPMNASTRPKVVSELRKWVDDELLPWLTPGFISEARTFVHRNVTPSPRHADGCNDDIVMATGIALEMYAEFGEHEHDRKKAVREKATTERTQADGRPKRVNSSTFKNPNPWRYQ